LLTSIIGIDLGYGFCKGTNGSRDVLFPSVVGMAADLAYRSELSLYTREEDNLIVEAMGGRYFVGSLAVRQSEIAARSLAEDRPRDWSARVLFLTGLGLLADGPVTRCNIVTGLPPADYRSYREALAEVMVGEHRVVFHGPRPAERLLVVENARVIPQPFGTVFDLFLDRAGNVQQPELAASRVGVIDIGFRTTDYAVADRLDYVERMSFSTTTGLAVAYALIADELQRSFGLNRTNYELDEVVLSGRLRLAGKVHDVSPLCEAAFRQVARQIITEANSAWRHDDLDVIYVTGGGGQALGAYLLDAFPNAALAPQAQTANVHGYWKLCAKLFGAAPTAPVFGNDGRLAAEARPVAER
jgi:plasmid segregation protein ParM